MKFAYMYDFNRTFQHFQRIIASSVEEIIVLMILIAEKNISQSKSTYEYML